jgi:hypothetical protein
MCVMAKEKKTAHTVMEMVQESAMSVMGLDQLIVPNVLKKNKLNICY